MKRVAVTAALVAVAVAAAAAVVLTRDDGRAPDERQAVLDRLVTGAGRVAPGVTAYVAGPNGTWSGAAGVANVDEDEPMRPDARLRLESVSKLWTAVVVLRLAADGKLSLEDTVERWLPGTFPDGDRMTVRQLLNHTSGLVNNDDVGADPQRMLALLRNAGLRGRVEAALRRVEAQPNWEFPVPLVVELAAAVPLVSEPGTAFRYSNIGYHVAGSIAERAGGRPFGELVDATIVRPLGLASARYDPHSSITGPHARGYLVGEGGALTDVTGQVFDLGANGGIVSNARDEARFLVALMSGDLLPARELAELKRPAKESYALGTGVFSSCAGTAYTHDGGGAGYATSAIVSGDGRHVAVVLANGRTGDDGRTANSAVSAAAITLFCGP